MGGPSIKSNYELLLKHVSAAKRFDALQNFLSYRSQLLATTVAEALLIQREALMRQDDSLTADPYFNKAIGRGINSYTLKSCLSNATC